MQPQYPPVPAYTNISHFRAPYLNSQVVTGVGADPVAPGGADQFVEMDKKGALRYRKEVAAALMKALGGYRAIFLNDSSVDLTLFTAEELAIAKSNPAASATLKSQSAAAWADQQLKDSKVVFATMGVLVPAAGEKRLFAVPESDDAAVNQTAHVAPILAEPSFLAGIFGSPWKLAAGAIVGVVLIGAAAKAWPKKKKTATKDTYGDLSTI